MVLYSGWLSISYSSSYYFRTCPTEEWLLISFSDRHTAKKFSCTKHLIGLRWSHTCSGKLETGFFANKISVNTKTAAQNSLRKKNSPSSPRRQTTWQLWEHMANRRFLVWSQAKIFRVTFHTIQSYSDKHLTHEIEKYKIKISRVIVSLDSIVTLTHSLNVIA